MTEPLLDPPIITASDMEALNQRELLRIARLARRASTVAMGVAVGLLGFWLWDVVRYQQLISSQFGQGDGISDIDIEINNDVPWPERVDWFSRSLGGFGFAILLGLGAIALRLYCDATTVRTGGDITPWSVGDPIEADEADADR